VALYTLTSLRCLSACLHLTRSLAIPLLCFTAILRVVLPLTEPYLHVDFPHVYTPKTTTTLRTHCAHKLLPYAKGKIQYISHAAHLRRLCSFKSLSERQPKNPKKKHSRSMQRGSIPNSSSNQDSNRTPIMNSLPLDSCITASTPPDHAPDLS
jgi:hypothetical protein